MHARREQGPGALNSVPVPLVLNVCFWTNACGMQRQEEENKRRMQDESKALEQLLNQRTVQLQKREDLNRKIRDLGVLPADAFDK